MPIMEIKRKESSHECGAGATCGIPAGGPVLVGRSLGGCASPKETVGKGDCGRTGGDGTGDVLCILGSRGG